MSQVFPRAQIRGILVHNAQSSARRLDSAIYHSDHAPPEEKTKYDKITALINEIKQEAGF
ncbi:hypothetical protein K435DRAFT_880243 [Dendrothele bispora CBS 962.96]|uniref:Uncharacterized protein n=1 Tax=Dendrothele bispora (strain CBS 962.96) TaxID=1314807 RepID=A0A4S8KJQ7_DENBC|nr:hypothetical protein K435DRAFT_880243 [Dendrothele bispora CBS 962.96]